MLHDDIVPKLLKSAMNEINVDRRSLALVEEHFRFLKDSLETSYAETQKLNEVNYSRFGHFCKLVMRLFKK